MQEVFAALSDPTRRLILDLIREHERTVTEIVEQLDISQPGVSKQLLVLRQAGLVAVRQDGQKRIYSLRREPLRGVDKWIRAYRPYWTSKLDALERHVQKMEGVKT